MADHLTKLHQLLFAQNLPPADLFHRLRSDTSLKLGLDRFFLILKRAVSPLQEDDDDDDLNNNNHKKLGFQSWTDSQVQSVVSFGLAILSASRSLSGSYRLVFQLVNSTYKVLTCDD